MYVVSPIFAYFETKFFDQIYKIPQPPTEPVNEVFERGSRVRAQLPHTALMLPWGRSYSLPSLPYLLAFLWPRPANEGKRRAPKDKIEVGGEFGYTRIISLMIFGEKTILLTRTDSRLFLRGLNSTPWSKESTHTLYFPFTQVTDVDDS